MTKIKLSCGFEAEIDETAIDDAEMLEQLTVLEDGDPTAGVRMMKLFGLDKAKRNELYDQLKGENGRASVDSVMKAIEEIFNVKVAKVNTINVLGKTKRMGRTQGKRPDYKKAIVKLAEGESIDLIKA